MQGVIPRSPHSNSEATQESHKNVCEMMLFISEKKNKKKATEEKR